MTINDVGTISLGIGFVLQYVGSIWMMVVGWKHWSIFVLTFAFPPMAVIFGLFHLDTAKEPLVAIAIGWALMAIGFLL